MVRYADNATGAASCSELRAWKDVLLAQGQGFGCFPNESKTHMIVKEEYLEKAKQIFAGTNLNISVEGKCHLGAAIGSRKYTEQYVLEQVLVWTQENNWLKL